MTAALKAGAADGRVIQHLTGGPELLDAYLDGSLFTPVERALIPPPWTPAVSGIVRPFRPRCWLPPLTARIPALGTPRRTRLGADCTGCHRQRQPY